MADLKTRYLNLELKNPLIVASSGLTRSAKMVAKCEELGAGAVVIRDVPDYGLMVGNPARLQGWYCACGTRLDLTTDPCSEESFQCKKCSRKYNKKGHRVTQSEDR